MAILNRGRFARRQCRVPGKLYALAAYALIGAAIGAAQPVSFGVVGGGYFNRDFVGSYTERPSGGIDLIVPKNGGFVAGPAIEYRLSDRFAIEGAALYKPLKYRDAPVFQDGAIVSFAPNPVVTWQFPALLRYRARVGGLYPFVEGGPSFRAAGNLNRANPSRFGATAGAGLEIPWSKLRFAPAARYTRWQADGEFVSARTRPDQLEFLGSVHYDSGSPRRPLGEKVRFGAAFTTTVTLHTRTETYTTFGADESSYLVMHSAPGRKLAEVGPMLELQFSPRWSIGANALPRSLRTRVVAIDHAGDIPVPFPIDGASGGFWEFPVLLKASLRPHSSVRPIVEAGPSFRLRKELDGAFLSVYGLTGGLGVEFTAGRLRFGPSVRFTHWGPDTQRFPGGSANTGVFRNQVQIVTGVSF